MWAFSIRRLARTISTRSAGFTISNTRWRMDWRRTSPAGRTPRSSAALARVHVAGITSNDVEGIHVLENHIAPLARGKVVYWCVGRNLRLLRRLGVRRSRTFPTTAVMLDALGAEIAASAEPIYLSIDKDVLAADVA